MNNILISEWTYMANGKLAREQDYDEKTGVFNYAVDFEYDSYGRLLKKGIQCWQQTYRYCFLLLKSNDRLENMNTCHEWRRQRKIARVKYGYDIEGRIIKQSGWIW